MGKEVEEEHVGRAGVVEVCLQWGHTCDEYRGFTFSALGPECVLALMLWAHIGEDELVHRTLLYDLHAWQIRDLGDEGWV